MYVVISCEHGGNEIPAEYTKSFADAKELLGTHRGYDIGALELAREFAKELSAPLHFSITSRLLVELNRSLHHKQLFSALTRILPKEQRRQIVETHYQPYRSEVEQRIAHAVEENQTVLHLSVHSFTPKLGDDERNADVGFLYDPQRKGEKSFCAEWKKTLLHLNPSLICRYNYPYRGTADGFTSYLRKNWSDSQYLGIELEVNQKWATADGWNLLKQTLVRSFAEIARK